MPLTFTGLYSRFFSSSLGLHVEKGSFVGPTEVCRPRRPPRAGAGGDAQAPVGAAGLHAVPLSGAESLKPHGNEDLCAKRPSLRKA